MSSRSLHAVLMSLAVLFVVMPVHAVESALSDPTRPSGYMSESDTVLPQEDADPLAGVRLGGIFTGPDGRTALLNGRRVSVGDKVGDLHVRALEEDVVIIERDGETWEISLGLRPVKRLTNRGNQQ